MFDTLKVIHGLVTRGSPRKTKHVSPHRRAGLTKLRVPVLAAPKWQPSLSPFTYEGFCVCRTQITPQSGLANGPGLGRTQETPCLARDHPGFNRPSQTERKADIQHPARGDIQTRKGYDSAGLGN